MKTDKSRNIGEGVRFERIRRITGYLVGTMDRWNNAKRAEERDRVKHGIRPNGGIGPGNVIKPVGGAARGGRT